MRDCAMNAEPKDARESIAAAINKPRVIGAACRKTRRIMHATQPTIPATPSSLNRLSSRSAACFRNSIRIVSSARRRCSSRWVRSSSSRASSRLNASLRAEMTTFVSRISIWSPKLGAGAWEWSPDFVGGLGCSFVESITDITVSKTLKTLSKFMNSLLRESGRLLPGFIFFRYTARASTIGAERMTKVGMSGVAKLAFAGFVVVGSSVCGWAQVTATISGKVEDATGAAVGGAIVTVKSLETGATRTVTTDETGNYRVLSLPVGAQEVRGEKQGFRTAVRTGITLVVGQEAVVDLKLDVGQVTQEVTVSAETPLIDTTTANVSGIVGERQIKELPLNGRSFDNLIALNPGSINYTYKSPGTVTSQGNTFSVAGRRPLENIFLVNGIEYAGSSQLANTPGGVSGYLLGIDAVREFNVQSGTYSAEYGKRAGAQVTAVTQSGTNQLHGTVFEFLRNSALDA